MTKVQELRNALNVMWNFCNGRSCHECIFSDVCKYHNVVMEDIAPKMIQTLDNAPRIRDE